MNRLQKFAATGALVVLLSVSQPAAAQAWWVIDSIRIIEAWKNGELMQELLWIGLSKLGERALESALEPSPAPEPTPAEPPSLPPLTFDLDGTRYLLAQEDAITLREDSTYVLPYCPLDSDARLFVFPSVTCPNGSDPQESDYAISRVGNTVTAERTTP
jgi:hypothetical protein